MKTKELSKQVRDKVVENLEGRVNDIVHRAFWDCLREQLLCSPPDYTHVVILLQEVKTSMLSLLLPGNVHLRAQVEEVLDLIQQQADHGALDLQRLSGYIINTMASLCAPIRDPKIRTSRTQWSSSNNLKIVQLSEAPSQNIPLIHRRVIFRVLGLIKADMVNFTVQSLRPHLLQQAVQYEQAKFQEILLKQPGGRTRSSIPNNQTYPETVLMDRARLEVLEQRLSLLVLQASVLLLNSTQCGATVFSSQGFVCKLKQTITALLEGSHNSDFDLQGALLGLGEQVLVQVKEALITQGGPALPQDSEDGLKRQISDKAKDNNPIRTLIGERVQGYLQAMLEGSPTKRSPSMSPALRLLSAELAELGMAFGRMVHFNCTIFGPFYTSILRKLLFPPGEAEMGVPPVPPPPPPPTTWVTCIRCHSTFT
ncbi:hypothetical protein J4Q44_G00084930 [Coregonus suidteri]|uniref:T-complex 11 n=1 Tax=Coregonus suidteri TaxID=861788 RepID=A0AAN8RC29_9TELE